MFPVDDETAMVAIEGDAVLFPKVRKPNDVGQRLGIVPNTLTTVAWSLVRLESTSSTGLANVFQHLRIAKQTYRGLTVEQGLVAKVDIVRGSLLARHTGEDSRSNT
jgi:hypothetical protein